MGSRRDLDVYNAPNVAHKSKRVLNPSFLYSSQTNNHVQGVLYLNLWLCTPHVEWSKGLQITWPTQAVWHGVIVGDVETARRIALDVFTGPT